MIKLEDEYKAGGMCFRLVKRVGDVCWYKTVNGVHEVFKVKVYPAGEMFGRVYPEREAVPGNEEWGKDAWSTMHEERAEAIFNELVSD